MKSVTWFPFWTVLSCVVFGGYAVAQLGQIHSLHVPTPRGYTAFLTMMYIVAGVSAMLAIVYSFWQAKTRPGRENRDQEVAERYEWHSLNICLHGTDEAFAKEMKFWRGRDKRDFRQALLCERRRRHETLTNMA